MARKKKSRKKKAASQNPSNPVISEIIVLVSIAFCVFLILSVFTTNGAGAVGEALKKGFTGLMGFGAYILPFIIIALCVYILFSQSKAISTVKVCMGIVLFFVVLISMHVLFYKAEPDYTDFMEYILSYYNTGAVNNGGLLGAMLGNFLLGVFGSVGTSIVLVTLGLIAVIVLTGRSFFDALSRFVIFIGDKVSSLSLEEELDMPEQDKPKKRVKSAEYEPNPEPPKPIKLPKPAVVKVSKAAAGQENAVGYIHEIKERDETAQRNRILLVNEDISRDEPAINLGRGRFIEELSEKEGTSEIFNKPAEKGEEKRKKPPQKLPEKVADKLPEAEIPPWEGSPNGFDYGADISINTAQVYEEPDDGLAAEPAGKDRIKDVYIEAPAKEYVFPPIDFLNENPNTLSLASKSQILDNSKKLEDALKSFGVEAKVMEVNVGPTVTRYELSPGQGVKVSRISGLSDDLALNLAAMGIRIEAPIPGKAAVGIEIPNKEASPVFLREVISDARFKNFPSKLAFALGKDIAGNVVVADIAKMPHMLIAGSTGSGKSVCINTLVASIIYKSKPDEVKLLMIDPKVVELKVYNGIPHLLIPVVTDPKKAAGALNWAVREMTDRYDLFAETNVRDLKGYNAFKQERGETDLLPQIVIIIDELADLMMTAGKEVEGAICRLAQMARAAGLHLVIATQRPSVDVITGLIKANIPSKISFAVSSGIDSRTILGENGAEKLLGKGDMLFYPTGMNKPMRVQGSYISDREVETIVNFIKQGADQEIDHEMIEKITSPGSKTGDGENDEDEDEFTEAAIEFIVKKEKASASMLQRQFRIGYNRASRLIEILEDRGIVGPEDGSKPRRVLMSFSEWQDYRERRS